MRSQEIFTSLDIGTTSIKVVVAEKINGNLNILGVGNAKSRGISNGQVKNIDEVVFSIRKAVEDVEEKVGFRIEEVILGVPTNKLGVEPCDGMVTVHGAGGEITAEDVHNVIATAKVKALPQGREILSVVPEEFIVNEFNGIDDPRGMIGVRLSVYAQLYTGSKTIIHSLRRCVEKSHLRISQIVLQPQAIASIALTPQEREFGTAIIDLGGGQSCVSIIRDNQLESSFVDQEGGDYVTLDISKVLSTSIESAEELKRNYGYAISDRTSETEYFPVEMVGKKEPVRVDERFLSEIIEARMRQIFETLYDEMERIGALDLPGGIVLTGGGSILEGTLDLAKEYFGSRVRLFVPHHMGLRNQSFTTGLGLVQYATELDDIQRIAQGTYFAKSGSTRQNVPHRPVHKVQEVSRRPIVEQIEEDKSVSYNEYQQQSYSTYEDDGVFYQDDDDRVADMSVGSGFLGKIQSLFGSFFD